MDAYRLTEVDTISASVGKIILFWGAAESYLNGLTILLLKPTNNPPPNKGVPVSFSRKIDLLKRCYRGNPRLAPIRNEARQVLTDLKPLHDRRVILAHGNYQGLVPGDKHMFIIYRSGRAKRHAWQWHYFTTNELDNLADRIMAAERAIESLVAKTQRLSA